MIDTELRFPKHVGVITNLLGGRAYMIHRISDNLADAGLIPGLRAAWIVGVDGDGVKPITTATTSCR